MRFAKHLALATATAGVLAVSGGTAAHATLLGGGDFRSGRAASYINPDVNLPTSNPDVERGSSCSSPDQFDKQMFSDAGSAARNVHNDACFLKNGVKVDGPASFESRGVGVISACPDPDGDGPRVAVLTDKNGDGRNDLCFQSGYQLRGVAGDLEFHARLNNNTATAGTQVVTWCSDADRDGCADERNRSSIRIDWSADGTVRYGSDRDQGLLSSLLRLLGLGR